MPIPTQLSLVGFVASSPELHFTNEGAECCRLRVCVEQWSREVDGRVTKLDRAFHDMLAFEGTARETYVRLRPGGYLVTSGYVDDCRVDNRAGTVIKAECVAREIGHSANKTNYVVHRDHWTAPEPTPESAPPPAVGM